MHQHRALGGILFACMLTVSLATTLTPAASQAADTKQTVTEGKNVSLEYTLTLDDKLVVESNVGKQPLTYTHGTRQIIPGLEKASSRRAHRDFDVCMHPEFLRVSKKDDRDGRVSLAL